MLNDRLSTRSYCLTKARIANLAPSPPFLWALGWLLLLLWTARPSQAGTTNFATSVASDVAINGSGYLLLSDQATGLQTFTRFGALALDPLGFLTTPSGGRVQGFTDPALTTIGDLQIDNAGGPGTNNPPRSLTSYEIQTNGFVLVNLSDGTSFVRCQILLQDIQNTNGLSPIWGEMLVSTNAIGTLTPIVAPGTQGTGELLSGYLEQFVPELQLSLNAGPPKTFTQGFLVGTDVPSDLGIQGGGFFVLRRTNDNAQFATRAGAFYIDGEGYLVHYSGSRLQGYTNSTTIGDLQIDPLNSPLAANPAVAVEEFAIDPLGVITEYLSDGSSFARGQVLLQACSNPDSLTRASFDLYPINTNSGLWSPLAQPFTANLGWIAEGSVELSQFDTNLLAVRSNLNFFIQGPWAVTGLTANLTIFGSGFFTVRDRVANIFYATRSGGFQLDNIGHLVTTNGLCLQGLDNAGLTQSGDIIIDTAGTPDPSLAMANYSIDVQGHIYVSLSDGSQFLRGQVLLQYYRNPQGLTPAGNGLYSNLTAAAPMFTNGLPGYIQQNQIMSGGLEEPPTPPALQLLPSSGFRLLVNDFNGGQIESSDDLFHWNVVGPVYYGALNAVEFFDTSPATQKFYRVVMPSPLLRKLVEEREMTSRPKK